MAKEVKKVEEAGLPADLDFEMLQQDSGAGVDTMTADDVALPYLGIIQAMSPQVQPGTSAYVEGIQVGMFINSVSQDYFDGRNKGLLFVPCAYDRRFVEWIDRDAGGGFVADYDIDSDILSHCKKDDKGKWRMPSGNLMVETAYHSGLYLDPEANSWNECVISLKSTGLKVNRKWNNDLVTTKIPGTDLQAPRWLYIYHLTTWLESKKNNSWWQLKAEMHEEAGKPVMVSRKVYDKAKNFHKLIQSGELKRGAEKEAPILDDSAPRSQGHHGDPDIPF